MELKLNKYTGAAYVNLIRQILSCRIPVVRPIAFKVGSESNVVDLGDIVEEDTSEFISNVSSSVFVMHRETDFYVWRTSVDSVLSFSGNSVLGDVTILRTGVSEVLHTLAPTSVEIYFRKGAGKFTAQENEAFLRAHEIETNSLVIINSRHCAVNCFFYSEREDTDESIIYDLTILPENGDTEEILLKKATDILIEDLREYTALGKV